MTLARALAAQLRRPTGAGGRLVARLMNLLNRGMHRAAADALEVGPRHHVLEIGFGGATLLEELLRRAPEGRVTGVELSGTMLERARRRLRRPLEQGRLALHEGSVDRLPFAGGSFDRVVSVNTIYFWPDPARGAGELRRVLAPGGRLVLGYAPREAMAPMPFTAHGFRLYDPDEVEGLLRRAGFAAAATRGYGRGRSAFVLTETSLPPAPSGGVPVATATSSAPD